MIILYRFLAFIQIFVVAALALCLTVVATSVFFVITFVVYFVTIFSSRELKTDKKISFVSKNAICGKWDDIVDFASSLFV